MGTPHPLRSLSLIQQNAQRLLTSTRWGRRSRRAATRIGADANFDDQTAIASRGTGRDPHQRALSRYRSACGRRRRARLSALSGSSPTAGRAHRRRAGRPLDPRQIAGRANVFCTAKFFLFALRNFWRPARHALCALEHRQSWGAERVRRSGVLFATRRQGGRAEF